MNDPSEVLVHAHAEPDEMLDHFTLTLELWCKKSGISHQHYKTLQKVLQIPKDISVLRSLPLGLSTLKKKCRAQFFILFIQQAFIPAVPLKMPTLSPAKKQLIQTFLTSNLFFQDPVALLSLLARSPVFHKKIHIDVHQMTLYGILTGHQSFLPILFISGATMLHNQRLACTKSSEIILIVQYTITANSFNKRIHLLRPSLCLNKLLLLKDQETHIIHEDNILVQLDVYLDYIFDRSGSYKLSETNRFFVHTPLQSELEIVAYRRDMLIKMLCPDNTIKRTISIPFLLFIDRFSLYQNMYQNITGFYIISAGLNDFKRRQQNNIYIIALRSHATNFFNVVEALTSSLQAVERGFDIVITGEGTVRVIASCIAYLDDILQQNDNAGIKHSTAIVFCQSCTVSNVERFNMNFNLMKHSQYHYQLLNLWAKIEVKWTVHDEFLGLFKIAHTLLISHILISEGQKEYCQILQRFLF
ncbi:uncharacterized protein CIMG_12959 [Coccidioides immitis RS]|uniref:Uncharacterized protein n=1 Tax=Coccidioides immitis (strain RS) TaxID=246410 RepID=J3K310_COCIM|nr:uncharacterized protein CIMG_12959 [Coccidioides immitis RS]EAS28525.3 hypothetical protein CIMG_12959 [Coccidioides immitis RS]